ncbi:rod shape-determining protein MreC [Actinomadura sp. DC4]|uniref:rod shape-determining protein MreC n=1 Tax=Actinomadura sp. DC4 TaxID=3055069 RepID=UPI0025AFAA04|nr:rod shape-determining protein MreC [Actinomadura sp. DC4]MDN3358184.1 rod shape-determining protein MreC [Actinomadura sp. DC4]
MNDTRRTRAVLGVLLLVSLAMITVDYRGGDDSPLSALRGFGEAIFGPIEHGATAVVRPVAGAVHTFTGAPGAHRRISTLERENQRLRQQLRTGQIDRKRADQLSRLLGTSGLGGYRIVPAEVISSGQGLEDTVSLDVGGSNGVKANMTVLSGDGLVGRVTRVGPSTSTVMLATDAASSIGGRLESSDEIGIVQGGGRRGGSALKFQLLDSTVAMQPGQRIVSFGSQGDRPYVPGVPIGTVTRIERTPGSLTRTAQVRPFVRFTALDVVGVVVTAPKRNPRDSVLPPSPSTSPPAPPPAPPRRPPPSQAGTSARPKSRPAPATTSRG